MCGILGQINYLSPINIDLFNRMRDSLIHRGPDGAGTKILNGGKVALGHRRLSIIDLSNDGQQPMCNEDESIWLTFNGEIYNYQDIKKDLELKNHTFKSKTDSEVLIHGYEEWGIEGLLSRIKGMFSFGIWDGKRKKLIAARDRFGMKPFFYYKDKEKLIFSSEIKGIHICNSIAKNIDNNSLADFFIYSYIPNPKTIWQNVAKLPPAHFLTYDVNTQRLETKKYWEIHTGRKILSTNEAVEQANFLIKKSVKEHLVSDVPVGIFLSGGYDSTTVLMHMSNLSKEISSFSIGFDESTRSEHLQAAEIAGIFNTNHHEEIISLGFDSFSLMEELSYFYDEPYAISSMLPYYLVSKLAAQQNKVVLVGDGGDEAFGGYKWHYRIQKFFSKTRTKALAGISPSWKKNAILKEYDYFMPGVFKDDELNTVLSSDIMNIITQRNLWQFEKYYRKKEHPVKSFQYLDFHTFIPEPCLTRADRSSMAHSIEVRVPFLDHEIFEFTFGLDPSVYFKKDEKKYLIKKNLEGKINDEILNMPKRGFSFQHLETLFNEGFLDLMKNSHLEANGIIEKGINLKKLSNRLKFHLLVLEFWFRKFYSK